MKGSLAIVWLTASVSGRRTRSIDQRTQPNILFIFPDELRYDWGGVATNPYYTADQLPLQTPNIDLVASKGTRFAHALVASPVCAPSRACLAAGREYDATGQGSNGQSVGAQGDFDVAEIPTFYQSLRDAGYHTMVTGRDDLTKYTGPGLDGQFHTAELGFVDSVRCSGSTDVTNQPNATGAKAHLPHEPFGAYLAGIAVKDPKVRQKYNASNLFSLDFARYKELGDRGHYDSIAWFAIHDPLPDDRLYQDDWIGARAVDLIKRAPENQPWFIEVSFQAPHPPFDITASMMKTVRGKAYPPAYNASALANASEVQTLRQNYAAKIERVDHWLGVLVDTVKAKQGSMENTIVCLASDHGEMLADRATTAKSKPWQSAMSVPVVCSGNGTLFSIAGSRVVSRPVASIDLAATFIDYGNATKPPGMSSQTLRPLMSLQEGEILPRNAAPASPRDYVFSGLANFRTVTFAANATTALKLICCNGPCPGGTAADRAGSMSPQGDEIHLFNISADRFERPENDLARSHPDVVADLVEKLPPADERKGAGYEWKGCRLA